MIRTPRPLSQSSASTLSVESILSNGRTARMWFSNEGRPKPLNLSGLFLLRLYGFICRMRRSLLHTMLWSVLLLAGIELALLELSLSGPGAAPEEMRWRVAEVTVAVALLAAGGALLFSHQLARRIARLRISVEGMVTGPAHIPRFESRDELSALAESLGRVAEQVNELVDKVRLEGARRDAILTGMVEGVLAVDQELR